MWYRFAKLIFAQNFETKLKEKQVPEEVIEFVKNVSDNELRGIMVATLFTNPQATIDDLEKISVVKKESWDISLAKLLKEYQQKGNLENYPLDDSLIISTVEEAKELNKNLGGQIKFESSFPKITLTVNNNVYIYDETSKEKSIEKFLQKLHELTGHYEWETSVRTKPSNLDAKIKTGTIEVVKCESRQDLLKYGAGETWCVCDPSSASHYIRYKVNFNGTFYIVFDGLKEDDDPAKKVLIVIGEKNNQPIEFADIRNGGKIKGYNNLEDYYVYLRENNVNTDQFVNDPMSEEERKIIEKVKYENKNIEWFTNLSSQEKTYYISMGYDLTNAQFDEVMHTDLTWSRNTILDAYVTTGKSLPAYQLNKLNKYNKDFIKSYKASRETYLNRMKQEFANEPEKLIQFAIKSFDRELLEELYKENKLNDNQISVMFNKWFAEDDQFNVRFGLEFSEVLPIIKWEDIVFDKLKNNTLDENFINKYKRYFTLKVWQYIVSDKLGKLDENSIDKYKQSFDENAWRYIVTYKLKNHTLDENFIDKYKDYFTENAWRYIVYEIVHFGCYENFEYNYKDYIDKVLPTLDWEDIVEYKLEVDELDDNFINKYKQYFDEYVWKYIVIYKLINRKLDENFIDNYKRDFTENVWKDIVTYKLKNNTLDENFINKYQDYLPTQN